MQGIRALRVRLHMENQPDGLAPFYFGVRYMTKRPVPFDVTGVTERPFRLGSAGSALRVASSGA